MSVPDTNSTASLANWSATTESEQLWNIWNAANAGGGGGGNSDVAVGPDGVTRVPLNVNAGGELKVNVEASINADLTLIENKLDTIIGIETPQAADVAAIKTSTASVATKMSDGSQTASIIIPTSFKTGQAKIAVTGTAVQLGSNTLTQGVLISALSTNTASITIGTSSGVTNTVDGTGNGSILTAGSTKSIAATNTNLVWINGTAGDIISFIGS
jgi:hypothetical protein